METRAAGLNIKFSPSASDEYQCWGRRDVSVCPSVQALLLEPSECERQADGCCSQLGLRRHQRTPVVLSEHTSILLSPSTLTHLPRKSFMMLNSGGFLTSSSSFNFSAADRVFFVFSVPESTFPCICSRL